MAEFYRSVEAALLEALPSEKCARADRLRRDWSDGRFEFDPDSPLLAMQDPGRPESPRLVDPRNLPRRSVATEAGRLCLLHAFAHIEFNAINIALDAVYRFRDMPQAYYRDWLQVADEEAQHFTLIARLLDRRGSGYGAFDAHRGLWDMVCKTRDDPLHRMALVPRVMEARGLDVTPGMIKRFEQANDIEAVNVLRRIYDDEIGHVRIGNRWYRFLCEQRGLSAETTFRRLVDEFMGGQLRGPFNHEARIEAGFERQELERLERAMSQGAASLGS